MIVREFNNFKNISEYWCILSYTEEGVSYIEYLHI